MREKSEVIERARNEFESKARAKDDTRKNYGGKSPLVLEILKTAQPRRGESSLRQKRSQRVSDKGQGRNDIRGIVKRTRAAANANTKANS